MGSEVVVESKRTLKLKFKTSFTCASLGRILLLFTRHFYAQPPAINRIGIKSMESSCPAAMEVKSDIHMLSPLQMAATILCEIIRLIIEEVTKHPERGCGEVGKGNSLNRK